MLFSDPGANVAGVKPSQLPQIFQMAKTGQSASPAPQGKPPRTLFLAIVIATVLALALPALLVDGLWLWLIEIPSAERTHQVDLQAKLDVLSGSLAEALWRQEKQTVDQIVAAAMQSPDVVRVQVRESSQGGVYAELARPERARGRQYLGDRDVLRDGIKIGAVRIEMDDGIAAASRLRQRWLYAAAVAAQLTISILLGVALFHSRVMQPLRKLGSLADRLAAGDFSVNIEPQRYREMSLLAGHLEHMRVTLGRQFEAMKQHEQKLRDLAHFDALTQLPNRVLLEDRMRIALIQSQRRHQSLAVVYLDLDGFKSVNDAHGHLVGDRLLIAVAQRMKSALREGDTLARIGGDEFIAVLVDLERSDDCKPVLDRMLKAAAEPVRVGDVVLKVSASLGVTIYPDDPSNAEQLIRHADQAMYRAKQAGKNRCHIFQFGRGLSGKSSSDFVPF